MPSARSSDWMPTTMKMCHGWSVPLRNNAASAKIVTADSALLTARMPRRLQRSTSAPATGVARMPGRKLMTMISPY